MFHLCVVSGCEPGYMELQAGHHRMPGTSVRTFLPIFPQVSKFAQEAIASPRTLELAMAKRLHPDYMPVRDAAWSVTKAAKQAVATPRLVELAQPCKRLPMNLTQFNPNAFTVKESAKKAVCSARIKELACPIKR